MPVFAAKARFLKDKLIEKELKKNLAENSSKEKLVLCNNRKMSLNEHNSLNTFSYSNMIILCNICTYFKASMTIL